MYQSKSLLKQDILSVWKEAASHSSILTRKVHGQEPDGLPSQWGVAHTRTETEAHSSSTLSGSHISADWWRFVLREPCTLSDHAETMRTTTSWDPDPAPRRYWCSSSISDSLQALKGSRELPLSVSRSGLYSASHLLQSALYLPLTLVPTVWVLLVAPVQAGGDVVASSFIRSMGEGAPTNTCTCRSQDFHS